MGLGTVMAVASRFNVRGHSRSTALRLGASPRVTGGVMRGAPNIALPSGNGVTAGGPDDEGEETT